MMQNLCSLYQVSTNVYMCVCVCAHACACVRVCVRVCAYVYIYADKCGLRRLSLAQNRIKYLGLTACMVFIYLYVYTYLCTTQNVHI